MAQVSLTETIKHIGSGVNRLAQIATNLGGGATDYDVAKVLRPANCAIVDYGYVGLEKKRPQICNGCIYASDCPRI